MALISTAVTALGVSMSHSSNNSCVWGSDVGFLYRASGALLRVPFNHSAVKLYPMILVLRHCHQVDGSLRSG